jgi:hypothetical protein
MVSTERARERTCAICGEKPHTTSWVNSRPVCSGRCYQEAVARVLASRRKPHAPAVPPPADVLDRTPLAVTEEMAERPDWTWPGRKRKRDLRGMQKCWHCRGMLPAKQRDWFWSKGHAYCTLTCMQRRSA